MYAETNFPTKAALVKAVKAHQEGTGEAVRVFQPGPFAAGAPTNGEVSLEGPHYPKPHRWYARVEIKDSVVVRVLKN